MPVFGKRSLNNLTLAHHKLQAVMHEAIAHYDFTVICSVRNAVDQNRAYELKRSKAIFGQSPHNYYPALAVDCIPYPFKDEDWEDTARFTAMAQAIKLAATRVGVQIDWGGDWKSFKDTPHFELHDWRSFIGTKYDGQRIVAKYSSIVHPAII